jgi:hypothetical protein
MRRILLGHLDEAVHDRHEQIRGAGSWQSLERVDAQAHQTGQQVVLT